MKNDDYFSGILEGLSLVTEQVLKEESLPTNDVEFWDTATQFLLQSVPHVSVGNVLSVAQDAVATEGQAIRLMLAIIAENDKLQKVQNEALVRINTKRREHGLELLKMPDWSGHAEELLAKLRKIGATEESTRQLKLLVI